MVANKLDVMIIVIFIAIHYWHIILDPSLKNPGIVFARPEACNFACNFGKQVFYNGKVTSLKFLGEIPDIAPCR